MQLGNYTRSNAATDDAAQHLSSITLARVGNGATPTLYATVPTWDAVGHVTSVAPALPTTTTTDYLAGGLAEQVVGGTLTSYYAVAGVVTAVSVGGTLSYLACDGLGSVTAALSSASAVLSASQLFGPYGATRYSSGVMPTAKGFTGQYADAATGLDYYSARYYDPLAGQFISADSVLPGDGLDVWGLSRYAYVEGNPETQAEPTGHQGRVGIGASHRHGWLVTPAVRELPASAQVRACAPPRARSPRRRSAAPCTTVHRVPC